MALPAAFNLTLELTRLIPLDLVGQAAQHAFFSLARQIKNSGSDITIERDLAQLFGRCRIAPQMDSSFRALVSHCSNVSLVDGISFVSGPGPTFARAVKERSYFSTLVQLSLLTWIHPPNDLARVLVESLEQKHQDAPDAFLPPPDQRDVRKVLNVIREQTMHYDWTGLLNAVAASIEWTKWANNITACFYSHFFMLKSLFDMLPLVQSLPLNRMIHIKCQSQEPFLIVWAHHVLGLTVLIKTRKEKLVRFGNGPEQMYVELEDSATLSSIALFESTTTSRYALVTIHADDSFLHSPKSSLSNIQGYGKTNLLEVLQRYFLHPLPLIENYVSMAVAMAIIIANAIDSKDGGPNDVQPDPRTTGNILRVSNLLFDTEINEQKVSQYVNHCQLRPLNETLDPPPSFNPVTSEAPQSNAPTQEIWMSGLSVARQLAILIAALMTVDDLERHKNLQIRGLLRVGNSDLSSAVSGWNGKDPLPNNGHAMFDVLALIICEQFPDPANLDRSSMLSSHGWSIYLSSLSSEDPGSLDIRRIKLAEGVPYYNNVRFDGIVDGFQIPPPPPPPPGVSDTDIEAERGNIPDSLCTMKVKRNRPMINVDGEYLSICVRFFPILESTVKGRELEFGRMMGYRELYRALWKTKLTRPCTHSLGPTLQLSSNCGSYSDPSFRYHENLRILVCLTQHDAQARWMMLYDFNYFTESTGRQVILRKADCCPACALKQAIELSGKWAVIL